MESIIVKALITAVIFLVMYSAFNLVYPQKPVSQEYQRIRKNILFYHTQHCVKIKAMAACMFLGVTILSFVIYFLINL